MIPSLKRNNTLTWLCVNTKVSCWQLNLLFLMLTLCLLSCEASAKSTSEETATVVASSLITITPSVLDLEDFPEQAVLIASWSNGPAEIYYLRINEDGTVENWRETVRGDKKNFNTGLVSSEVLLEIKDRLMHLEDIISLEPEDAIGTMGITLLARGKNVFSLTCGNQNCRVEIRELFALILSHHHVPLNTSPFIDEGYILSSYWSPEEIGWFTWQGDEVASFKLLIVNNDSQIQLYEFVESFQHVNEIVDTEAWFINRSEMEQLLDCFQLLSTDESSNIGIDAKVVKFGYLPAEHLSIIRFSKQESPYCLTRSIEILQSSLDREMPNATLQINPFGE